DPIRNVWISRIDQAVGAAQGPVILIGHSLGCQAIIWWASLLGEGARGNVVGALLVAPPDVDRLGADPRIERFAPTPKAVLPFPTIVAASSDDIWCEPGRAEELAATWGAHFVLLDQAGHINADSGLGAWREGQDLLERLLDARARTPAATGWHGGPTSAPRQYLAER
ncbi:MAG TPA: alpha/beta hydrolase, partial [Sphingomonas sp.]|nr:alpha/beta hydrolase [Sphingomonas sp.]